LAHPRLEALTRDAIIRAARDLVPGDIRKWSVIVEGREFPVKQLVREAANQLQNTNSSVTPADLTAHDAVRYLRRCRKPESDPRTALGASATTRSTPSWEKGLRGRTGPLPTCRFPGSNDEFGCTAFQSARRPIYGRPSVVPPNESFRSFKASAIQGF
jgi:hypothetical protein